VRGLLERAVQQLEPAPATPSTPTAGAFLRGPDTFAGYAREGPHATGRVGNPEVPA
jgi:hypothetical protein